MEIAWRGLRHITLSERSHPAKVILHQAMSAERVLHQQKELWEQKTVVTQCGKGRGRLQGSGYTLEMGPFSVLNVGWWFVGVKVDLLAPLPQGQLTSSNVGCCSPWELTSHMILLPYTSWFAPDMLNQM